MLDLLTSFQRRKPNPHKLTAYGFAKDGTGYLFSASVPQSQIRITLHISPKGKTEIQAVDGRTGQPYVAWRVAGAQGVFVGQVRQFCKQLLADVAQNCFEPDIFQNAQTKRLIKYIQNTYKDEPEYLWAKFPENAVLRRKDNAKWYAAILRLPAAKIRTGAKGMTEILDLRADPLLLPALLNGTTYLPGYHMNKKSWYTLELNGNVPDKEIFRRVEESYVLAAKKGKS